MINTYNIVELLIIENKIAIRNVTDNLYFK